jgi:hypothetical protein
LLKVWFLASSINEGLKATMKETILQGWQDAWPTVKSSKPLATGVGVIDESAFNTIEVDKVFDAVNHASTTIGQAVLFRSLTQPLDALDEIKAKQEAVEELCSNSALKDALENILETAAKTSIYCCSANFWARSAQPEKSMKLKVMAICNTKEAFVLCLNW